MDLPTLIAQWSGKLPPGFVPPARIQNGLAECSLCVAPHNEHYVARVLMGSCKARSLILIDLCRRDST